MSSNIGSKIEKLLGGGTRVFRGWVLSGAGPARFGWYEEKPCSKNWLGRTLARGRSEPHRKGPRAFAGG
jgi:hypothetical protein